MVLLWLLVVSYGRRVFAEEARALLDRGVALHASGDSKAALATFDAVLSLKDFTSDYDLSQAFHNKAAIYHLANEPDVALVAVNDALAYCSEKSNATMRIECPLEHRSNALNTRGVILRGRGERRGAIRAFVRALALSPQNGHASVNLASVAENDVLAARYYRRSLASPAGSVNCQVACLNRVDVINDLALVLDRLGRHDEAVGWLTEAVALAPDSLQALGNLAIYQRDAGDLKSALETARKGLALAPESVPMMHNLALIEQKSGNLQRALDLWQKARQLGQGYPQPLASLAHHEGYRGNTSGAKILYLEALAVAERVNHAETDALRLQVVTSVVPHVYESTSHAEGVYRDYVDGLEALLQRKDLRVDDPIHSTGSGALGYYLEYTGQDDLPPRRLLAKFYWRASQNALHYVAPFLTKEEPPPPAAGNLIKVGFLSAFVYTHSVGLLTRGVIARLNRSAFHVVLLIIDDDEPTRDDLTAATRSSVDEVVTVPTSSLLRAQVAIAAAELDILVFCEIGMHTLTYFLSFARLARKTVLFWGHAVTSGVSRADAADGTEAGGIDYFVSSELFVEDRVKDLTLGQRDYSERLWLMSGLTTCFERPVAPAKTLDLKFPPYERLYVVPQTVYKLHPDFDKVIYGVLRKDPSGLVALPEAQHADWTSSLKRRWDAHFDDDIRRRIVFVRRLGFDEFIKFVQDADVILDPFPVGGGRSSLEIFSVGTPVVMLEDRTSILQLTRGMYELMGDPCPECVTHSIDGLVDAAVALANDRDRNLRVRENILDNKNVLYDNRAVVDEWDHFLTYVAENPRPAPPKDGDRALVAREELRKFQDENRRLSNLEKKTTTAKKKDSTRKQQGYVRRGTWGWEFVSGGNDEVLDDGEIAEAVGALAYAVKLSHPDPRTGQSSSFLVGVTSEKDATTTARDFADYIGAEPVKYRWIAAMLQNGAHRSEAPIVATYYLEDSPKEYEIDVRLGDDLAQIAAWHGLRLGLGDDAVAVLRSELSRLTPQRSSPDWLRARFNRDLLATDRRKNDGEYEPKEEERLDWSDDDNTERTRRKVTIGLTTCKRLGHFRSTMRGLCGALGVATPGSHPSVARVLVVDDGSSEDDRVAMAREWPDVDFFHKAPRFKGHAQSLNLLLRLVETRYFLYLEDDWLALPHIDAQHILHEPLAVIEQAQAAGEPLVQVLLNDQATRGCAYAIPESCGPDDLGRAGWHRAAVGEDKRNKTYRLHDFGTVEPHHHFTYWPGFTLNPALWDLVALKRAFHDVLGASPFFSTTESRFEQAFSLRAYDAGLRVAYLPRMAFAHIGVDESAYALNNISRPWDDHDAPHRAASSSSSSSISRSAL